MLASTASSDTPTPLCVALLPAPVCLLYCTPTQTIRSDDNAVPQLCLDEDALKEITDAVGECELLVCTVSGPYRTGKSFLLNRLFGAAATGAAAGPRAAGFGVSHSTRAATKGVWAWAGTLPSLHCHRERVLLVLDTEGIGDPRLPGVSEQDVRRLLISVLLSSQLVFNLHNVINDETIKMLAFVADLPQMMAVNGRSSSAAASEGWRSMPDLTFLLRDFSKDLSVFDGDSTRYVQQLLATNEAKGDRTCSSLLQCFPRIRCATLMQPVLKPEVELKELDQPGGAAKYLRPEFVQQLDRFWRQLLADMQVKQVDGVPLTGFNLRTFVKAVVSTINQPRHCMRTSFPSLREAMESGELERELQLALDRYEKEMRASSASANSSAGFVPVEEAALVLLHSSSTSTALQRVRTIPKLQRICSSVEASFLAGVDPLSDRSLFSQLKLRNHDASRALCLTVSSRLSQSMDSKLAAGEFVQQPQQFEQQLAWMLKTFDQEARGPLKAEERSRLLQKEAAWRAALRLQLVQSEVAAAKLEEQRLHDAASAVQQQLALEKLKQEAARVRLEAEQRRLEQLCLDEEKLRRQDKEALEQRLKQLADSSRRVMSAEVQASNGGPSLPSPWRHLQASERTRLLASGSLCPWCPAKAVHPVPNVSSSEEWRCRMCSKPKRGVMHACVACGSRIDADCFADYLWEH